MSARQPFSPINDVFGRDVDTAFSSQTVRASDSVTSTTVVVDVSGGNDLAYAVYNEGATNPMEVAFGGRLFGELTANNEGSPPNPVISQSGDIVTVQCSNSEGQTRIDHIIVVYASDNSVIFTGRVIGRKTLTYVENEGTDNEKIVPYEVLVVKVLSGATPTNGAVGDKVGYPNAYALTAGTGHVVFPSSRIVVAPDHFTGSILLRSAEGTTARVVRIK